MAMDSKHDSGKFCKYTGKLTTDPYDKAVHALVILSGVCIPHFLT